MNVAFTTIFLMVFRILRMRNVRSPAAARQAKGLLLILLIFGQHVQVSMAGEHFFRGAEHGSEPPEESNATDSALREDLQVAQF